MARSAVDVALRLSILARGHRKGPDAKKHRVGLTTLDVMTPDWMTPNGRAGHLETQPGRDTISTVRKASGVTPARRRPRAVCPGRCQAGIPRP
jgi:hypothetical protein